MTSDPKSTTQPNAAPQTRAVAVSAQPPAIPIEKTGDTLAMIRQWGALFAQAGFFKDAKTEAQAAVKVMYGVELGFTVGAAISGVYIIEGKLSLSANMQAAKVRTSGRYDYEIVYHDDTECRIAFYRRTSEKTMEKFGESSFSLEDADRAALLSKDVWRKYPRNMLFSRALTNGIRFYCPDLFGVAVYTPDELVEDIELTESGDIVDASVVAPAPPRRERAERQERPASGSGTARQRGPVGPTKPEEIADLPGLLTWAGNFRKANNLPIAQNAVNEALDVESVTEIRPKFEGRWVEAAHLIMRHAGIEPPSADEEQTLDERVASLDEEQRKAYDEQIALGMSPEDALVLALPDADADDVSAAAEAAEDDGESDAAAEE